MRKAVIIYESKYGNTKLVAEAIAAGLATEKQVAVTITAVGDADIESIASADIVLFGSPNHMGRPTSGIIRFIDKLGKLKLDGKTGAVFDTYMFSDYEKAVKRIEAQLKQKAPALKLAVPGLSVRVTGMKGPIADDELTKAREFGIKIAGIQLR